MTTYQVGKFYYNKHIVIRLDEINPGGTIRYSMLINGAIVPMQGELGVRELDYFKFEPLPKLREKLLIGP